MSIHAGHRQRVKERFLREGLDNFTDIQVLELLLFYAIPQKDTNPIAHALLERFGSLPQVMEASVEELEKVPGMGRNAALLLALAPAVGRFYMVQRSQKATVLNTIQDCGDYLKSVFIGRRTEMVYLLCLDAKCKVLACRQVAEGSVNSANVPIRRIVEMALAANATTVILAHNHPSGIAIPSSEDIATTQRLAAALATVEISLADHIIVADDDYVSLAHTGYQFRDLS